MKILSVLQVFEACSRYVRFEACHLQFVLEVQCAFIYFFAYRHIDAIQIKRQYC